MQAIVPVVTVHSVTSNTLRDAQKLQKQHETPIGYSQQHVDCALRFGYNMFNICTIRSRKNIHHSNIIESVRLNKKIICEMTAKNDEQAVWC